MFIESIDFGVGSFESIREIFNRVLELRARRRSEGVFLLEFHECFADALEFAHEVICFLRFTLKLLREESDARFALAELIELSVQFDDLSLVLGDFFRLIVELLE